MLECFLQKGEAKLAEREGSTQTKYTREVEMIGRASVRARRSQWWETNKGRKGN